MQVGDVVVLVGVMVVVVVVVVVVSRFEAFLARAQGGCRGW